MSQGAVSQGSHQIGESTWPGADSFVVHQRANHSLLHHQGCGTKSEQSRVIYFQGYKCTGVQGTLGPQYCSYYEPQLY